jgi:Methyltransferase domain
MPDPSTTFLATLQSSIESNTFVKLTLGNYHGLDTSLRKVTVKPVTLARGQHLSFVYRHTTKDVTTNMPPNQGLALIAKSLGTEFSHANLFTTDNDIELVFDKKKVPRLRVSKPTQQSPASKEHNRAKKRWIDPSSPYLALLGVTAKDGKIKKGMEAKFRQINKFVEIIDGLVQSSPLKNAAALTVWDMGSGKGYLTFAMYDHLTRALKKQVTMSGVEARPGLVEFCNKAADAVGFSGLRFQCGSIQDIDPGPANILIALHACDTATDQALYQAIKSEATLIVCAPCCHKELRPQIRCAIPGLQQALKSGILLERQAELVTDSLRAMLLEAHGYKTSVFEFIATEHTSKNTMIVGVKKSGASVQAAVSEQIAALKTAFGIEGQFLELLLLKNSQ